MKNILEIRFRAELRHPSRYLRFRIINRLEKPVFAVFALFMRHIENADYRRYGCDAILNRKTPYIDASRFHFYPVGKLNIESFVIITLNFHNIICTPILLKGLIFFKSDFRRIPLKETPNQFASVHLSLHSNDKPPRPFRPSGDIHGVMIRIVGNRTVVRRGP